MAKGGEDVAIDVFEVFDRQSGGQHTPSPPPKFQGAKTFFAVGLAVAVLVGMAWGAYSLVRGIATHRAEAAVCTTAQTEAQDVVNSWLAERVSQATGATDAPVKPRGCTKATAGQPVGGSAYLRERSDLTGAVGTLEEHGCEMKISAAGAGTCTVDVEGLTATVKIARTPADDTEANGDFVWSIEIGKQPA